ncbi:MAG: hypothetical protein OQK98_06630 [Gammaproteobacteria bacterium]|nr:hypothetical protein [Gammaproteobacteria bacterium]
MFIVEQVCRPEALPGSTNGCHGWIKYKIPDTGEEIKKNFGKLENLPRVIHELMHEVAESDNCRNSKKNDDH